MHSLLFEKQPPTSPGRVRSCLKMQSDWSAGFSPATCPELGADKTPALQSIFQSATTFNGAGPALRFPGSDQSCFTPISSIPTGDIADEFTESVDNISHPSIQLEGTAGNEGWNRS